MSKEPLHITNGTNLTNYLNELEIVGEKLTWEEMLCEGPTTEHIDSAEFLDLRKTFFNDFYDIDLETDKILIELEKLNHPENYSEIVLWFDFDLFCYINMVAVITLIQQQKMELPIYFVQAKSIDGSKLIKGTPERNTQQLLTKYKKKTKLNDQDIELASTIWGIYCGRDHNLLKPFIVKSSTFKYLSNCLKAHLERFPDSKDGLNIMERNILEIVRDKSIKSKHHLLGYALNYQGYYGFGYLQLSRIIDKLAIFFIEENGSITLNRDGHEALLGQHNFAIEIDNNMIYGGVKKFDFQFNKQLNKLVKTITNAY
tara:strand:+ start:2202 stop:3143 length:942 start_codon:yes stop_codon:yes gene_type:complete